MSKCNWKEVFSNGNSYYGFGYSLLLVPLFYICETGLELIRGAIVVNIICILLLYLLQIYFMSKIFPTCKVGMLAIMSGVVCLYPYLQCSTMKVMNEVFLTLWVWVIGILLYKALATGKYLYFILLGITAVYIYFIHFRSVAVLAALGMCYVMMLYCKKVDWRKTVAFLIVFILGFAICNALKKA